MEGYLHSFQGCFPYLNILNSVTFITDTTVIVTPTIKQNITHIDFPWPKYCLYQSDLLSSCHTESIENSYINIKNIQVK
jgi:hypothetical protein